MALTNNESSYIQAVSNRFDNAVPGTMEAYTPGAGTITQPVVMYLTNAANVTFQPWDTGTSITVGFAAGWVPVRVREITAVSAGSVYIAY